MTDSRTFNTLFLCTGNSARSQMAVPDPARTPDDPKGFRDAWITLRRRIELLLALPLEKLDHLAREQELRAIGQQGGQP